MKDLDTTMYIEIKGREWVVWLNPDDELLAVPTDEKPFGQDDLLMLENYLYNEGFFKEHYDRQEEKLDQA